MDLLKLVFKVVIIAIVYIIIFFALRIMYKDIKNGGKRKVKRKAFGLEIVEQGENKNLKNGGVIPIQNGITIGRKENNMVILNDGYVSGNHAKIYLKNTDYFIEDLNSTNGTLLNSKRVNGKVIIKKDDIIKIGTSEFRVIG